MIETALITYKRGLKEINFKINGDYCEGNVWAAKCARRPKGRPVLLLLLLSEIQGTRHGFSVVQVALYARQPKGRPVLLLLLLSEIQGTRHGFSVIRVAQCAHWPKGKTVLIFLLLHRRNSMRNQTWIHVKIFYISNVKWFGL